MLLKSHWTYDPFVMKQAHDYELIAGAYHEAGHTICGLLQCIKVNEVSVIPTEDRVGITIYEILDEDNFENKKISNYFVKAWVEICYAGVVAEKIYYYDICGNSKFPLHLRIGSSEDFREASKYINNYNLAPAGMKRQEYKKKLQKDIEKYLLYYWSDVKLVSHSLYKKRKLSFHDLKLLLTRKSVNKFFWKEQFKKLALLEKMCNTKDEDKIYTVLFK